MAPQICFLLCIQALFAQVAFGQCIGGGFPNPYGSSWGYENPYDMLGSSPFEGCIIGPVDNYALNPYDISYAAWPNAYGGPSPFAPAPVNPAFMYGGGMPLATGTSTPPAGLSVLSENFIEGLVTVVGQLPFLGSVTMSGEFPTAGAGAVSYGCGDGSIGIVADRAIPPGTPIGPAVSGSMEYVNSYTYGPPLMEGYRNTAPYTGGVYNLVY